MFMPVFLCAKLTASFVGIVCTLVPAQYECRLLGFTFCRIFISRNSDQFCLLIFWMIFRTSDPIFPKNNDNGNNKIFEKIFGGAQWGGA